MRLDFEELSEELSAQTPEEQLATMLEIREQLQAYKQKKGASPKKIDSLTSTFNNLCIHLYATTTSRRVGEATASVVDRRIAAAFGERLTGPGSEAASAEAVTSAHWVLTQAMDPNTGGRRKGSAYVFTDSGGAERSMLLILAQSLYEQGLFTSYKNRSVPKDGNLTLAGVAAQRRLTLKMKNMGLLRPQRPKQAAPALTL